MLIKRLAVHCRACSLPTDVITRIHSVSRHKKNSEQINALSLVFPHSNAEEHHWYMQNRDFPYLHVINTAKHGSTMSLHVLIPSLGCILTLEKEGWDWYRGGIVKEDEVASVVPWRFSKSRSSWMHQLATDRQLETVADILALPVQCVPPLTAFNANAVIQTAILQEHLPKVIPMLNHWISHLRSSGMRPKLIA